MHTTWPAVVERNFNPTSMALLSVSLRILGVGLDGQIVELAAGDAVTTPLLPDDAMSLALGVHAAVPETLTGREMLLPVVSKSVMTATGPSGIVVSLTPSKMQVNCPEDPWQVNCLPADVAELPATAVMEVKSDGEKLSTHCTPADLTTPDVRLSVSCTLPPACASAEDSDSTAWAFTDNVRTIKRARSRTLVHHDCQTGRRQWRVGRNYCRDRVTGRTFQSALQRLDIVAV